MKIFFVSRGWPSEREPQWGNFERDQAMALKELGHTVVVLSVETRFRAYRRKIGITKTMHGGIPHYNLFAGSIWRNMKTREFLFLYLYKKVIKQEGIPDIVYGHYLGNISMAVSAKTEYGIPVVGIEHWSELGFDRIKRRIKNEAGKTYKDVDRLLTVSSTLRQNILKNFGIDSTVVNNMVGREFRYVPKERNERKVRYVSTGNLLPVKGFDNLIKAFTQLQLPDESWSLDIIGGGSEHARLQGMIDQFHLGKNIRLCGRKSREGVIGMLQQSDVYVMSSRSETFGVAAIEALACGLPVIATDCGGARDFLTEKNGLLCPVNNVSKLADAILRMYKYHKTYDRARIAQDCQDRFSSEAIGKQLEGIFEKVISEKR